MDCIREGVAVSVVQRTVGLADNVEWRSGVVGIGLEESLQKVKGILRNHRFVRVVFGSVAKADTRGLVEPKDVSRLGPRIGVDGRRRAIASDFTRAVFRKKSQSRRASRTSSQPDLYIDAKRDR